MIKTCCPLFKEHLAEWILFKGNLFEIIDDKFYYQFAFMNEYEWDWNTVEIKYCPFCGAKITLQK
jgi:hypothetical protein